MRNLVLVFSFAAVFSFVSPLNADQREGSRGSRPGNTGSSELCLYAGHYLYKQNGVCPTPPACPNDPGKIQCNPVLFGNGVCIAPQSNPVNTTRGDCRSVAGNRTVDPSSFTAEQQREFDRSNPESTFAKARRYFEQQRTRSGEARSTNTSERTARAANYEADSVYTDMLNISQGLPNSALGQYRRQLADREAQRRQAPAASAAHEAQHSAQIAATDDSNIPPGFGDPARNLPRAVPNEDGNAAVNRGARNDSTANSNNPSTNNGQTNATATTPSTTSPTNSTTPAREPTRPQRQERPAASNSGDCVGPDESAFAGCSAQLRPAVVSGLAGSCRLVLIENRGNLRNQGTLTTYTWQNGRFVREGGEPINVQIGGRGLKFSPGFESLGPTNSRTLIQETPSGFFRLASLDYGLHQPHQRQRCVLDTTNPRYNEFINADSVSEQLGYAGYRGQIFIPPPHPNRGCIFLQSASAERNKPCNEQRGCISFPDDQSQRLENFTRGKRTAIGIFTTDILQSDAIANCVPGLSNRSAPANRTQPTTTNASGTRR